MCEAGGIAQVNTAIAEMSRMTQENAAMAEQTNAATSPSAPRRRAGRSAASGSAPPSRAVAS